MSAEYPSALRRAQALVAGAARICCFSGAGLSAESGIETFRGNSQSARWRRFDPMTLASPEGFAADPEQVMSWYNDRRQTLAEAQPHRGHRALADRPDIEHVTQNVDDLLERAGIAAAQVHHLHGTLLADRCHAQCGYRETIALDNPPSLRHCPACGAALRPAVVWFGESLDPDTWRAAEQAIQRAEVLLVVGTSAVVMPAAAFIDSARANGAAIVWIDPQADDQLPDDDRFVVLRCGAAEALVDLLA